MKILYLDDDPADRELMSIAFERFQPEDQLELVASWGELEATLKDSLPDLILLDVNMPGLDGFEVLERVRNEELAREIPAIFLSTSDQSTDKIEGKRVGAIGFCTKPSSFAAMKLCLAQIRDVYTSWQYQQRA